ncbi:hypothetical protein TNCV_3276051 [Trichonephila clavipes]|nr:hypothetical protein TNCV_3276051 [Trichonephila clavipes]
MKSEVGFSDRSRGHFIDSTPSKRTVKGRKGTGSPVSPYPSRPAQLIYAAGSTPLRRASRQAPEISSHPHDRDEDLGMRSGAPAPSIQHL